MSRVLIVVGCLLASPLAFAQDPPAPAEVAPAQLAPAPTYGRVPSEPMTVHVNRYIGFMLGGGKPFGTFGDVADFGPDFTFRGGVEIVIGPGFSIAPEGTIRFSAFPANSPSVSSFLFAGFAFGGRFGFEIANLVTPYMAFHLGYSHVQETGSRCDEVGAICSTDKPAVDFGFGAEFWVTPKVGLGPFLALNFVLTDGATANWFSFGPSLTLRL